MMTNTAGEFATPQEANLLRGIVSTAIENARQATKEVAAVEIESVKAQIAVGLAFLIQTVGEIEAIEILAEIIDGIQETNG